MWLFDVNPAEAKLIDPQQRVLLEVAFDALESSAEGTGLDPRRDHGRTGVFAGVEDNTYYKMEILPFPEAEARAGRFSIMTGNEKDYVAMRIAHKLNLRGPAISVHTACSTSLVAVIMACKSLRTRECDLALAGAPFIFRPTTDITFKGRCLQFRRAAVRSIERRGHEFHRWCRRCSVETSRTFTAETTFTQ